MALASGYLQQPSRDSIRSIELTNKSRSCSEEFDWRKVHGFASMSLFVRTKTQARKQRSLAQNQFDSLKNEPEKSPSGSQTIKKNNFTVPIFIPSNKVSNNSLLELCSQSTETFESCCTKADVNGSNKGSSDNEIIPLTIACKSYLQRNKSQITFTRIKIG